MAQNSTVVLDRTEGLHGRPLDVIYPSNDETYESLVAMLQPAESLYGNIVKADGTHYAIHIRGKAAFSSLQQAITRGHLKTITVYGVVVGNHSDT